VTKDETTVVEGGGSADENQGRINQIKAEIEKHRLRLRPRETAERLAKLSGGVAVIKVGAATEVELKEKKHRIEDAVSTTKAAIEEGVVPGGGVALLRSQAAILDTADSSKVTRPPVPASWPGPSKSPSSRLPSMPVSRVASSWDKVRNLKKPNEDSTPHRRIRGPVQNGCDRCRQGDPVGPAERSLDRRAVPHHRGGPSWTSLKRVPAPCPAEGWTTSKSHHPADSGSKNHGTKGARWGALRSFSRLIGVTQPLAPSIGWGVLHLFCQLGRPSSGPGGPAVDDQAVIRAVKEAEADQVQVVT